MAEWDDTTEEVRARLVKEALVHVPFDGWCMATLRLAARNEGFDETLVDWAFPGGPVEAIAHWFALADQGLEKEAVDAGLDAMAMDARLAWLVRRRLEIWSEHRESVRRALGLLALPGHAAMAARITWHCADAILFAANDRSADSGYYAKRLALGALFDATLVFWLADNSEGNEASWNFLERRLSDGSRLVKTFETAVGRIEERLQSLRSLFLPGSARRRFGIRS